MGTSLAVGGSTMLQPCCLVGQRQPQDLVPANMVLTPPPYSVSSASGSCDCLVSSHMSFLLGLHTLLRALMAPAHPSAPLPCFPQTVSYSISGGSGLVPGRIQHVSRNDKRGEHCFVSQLPSIVVPSILLHLLTCQSRSSALPLPLSLPVVCEWQSEVPH